MPTVGPVGTFWLASLITGQKERGLPVSMTSKAVLGQYRGGDADHQWISNDAWHI